VGTGGRILGKMPRVGGGRPSTTGARAQRAPKRAGGAGPGRGNRRPRAPTHPDLLPRLPALLPHRGPTRRAPAAGPWRPSGAGRSRKLRPPPRAGWHPHCQSRPTAGSAVLFLAPGDAPLPLRLGGGGGMTSAPPACPASDARPLWHRARPAGGPAWRGGPLGGRASQNRRRGCRGGQYRPLPGAFIPPSRWPVAVRATKRVREGDEGSLEPPLPPSPSPKPGEAPNRAARGPPRGDTMALVRFSDRIQATGPDSRNISRSEADALVQVTAPPPRGALRRADGPGARPFPVPARGLDRFTHPPRQRPDICRRPAGSAPLPPKSRPPARGRRGAPAPGPAPVLRDPCPTGGDPQRDRRETRREAPPARGGPAVPKGSEGGPAGATTAPPPGRRRSSVCAA